MGKKTVIWAAFVNLNGLVSEKPMRLTWREDQKCYWSVCGNFDVNGPGNVVGPGHQNFASYKKRDVALWIHGAKAVMGLLRNFVRRG